MELLLIRHARPLRAESVDGPADPGLSELGRRQAAALAAWYGARAGSTPSTAARCAARSRRPRRWARRWASR